MPGASEKTLCAGAAGYTASSQEQAKGGASVVSVRRWLCAVGVATALGACGGSNPDDAVCADFQYQEDAQAAYAAGAKQLDRDNDGIACEHLPHRPAAPPTPPSANSYPPYDFLLGNSLFLRLGPAFGGYGYQYNEYGGAGGGSGPVYVTTQGGANEFAITGLRVRYVRTSDSTLLTWTAGRLPQPDATGIGINAPDAAELSDLEGTYKLLGQRCVPATGNCTMVVATASVSATGGFHLCLGSEYGTNCPNPLSRTLTRVAPFTAGGGVSWSLGGGSSENLLGSKTRGTLALWYREWRIAPGTTTAEEAYYAFFGQRDALTRTTPLDGGAMLGFDPSGQLRNEPPPAAQWNVTAHRPLVGFFQDGGGNTYLVSATGQLVVWSVGGGLRHFSKP